MAAAQILKWGLFLAVVTASLSVLLQLDRSQRPLLYPEAQTFCYQGVRTQSEDTEPGAWLPVERLGSTASEEIRKSHYRDTPRAPTSGGPI